MFKICNTCKIEKSLSEFHKRNSVSSGICGQCKNCRSEYNKKRYENKKDIIKKKTNSYYQNNKEAIRPKRKEYQKRKEKEDVKFRLTRRLRNRLYYALQKKSWKKETHFSQYIGCTLDELKLHIQNSFKDGMTWENYGKWHIDHIVPLNSANTEEELYKLCHYTNLQPLWGRDNLSKGSKF